MKATGFYRKIVALGQAPEDVNLMDAVRTIYGGYKNVEPIVEFVGNYPMLSISMAMLAVGIGAAVGAYLGAGVKAT